MEKSQSQLKKFDVIDIRLHLTSLRVLSVSQDLSSTRNMSLAASDPHKLDLMAENSSLKVKLAKAEKSLRDSEERLVIAQVCSVATVLCLFWSLVTLA